MDKRITNMLQSLEQWFSTNGLAGFDPYDAKGLPHLLFAQRHRLTRAALNILLEGAPRASRWLLRVKPTVNAKGLALLMDALINRFETTGDQHYLEQAQETGQWLLTHGADWRADVYAWGYPFNWQSRVMIPRGTPSSVVTAFVLQAILHLAKHRPEIGSPLVYDKIARFFAYSLNRLPEGCFSYTPTDTFRVHNANLFSVWSLLKLAMLTGEPSLKSLAMPALRYTIDQQGSDGEFGYWGDELDHPVIDNFHTGYVIRSLHRIHKLAPETELMPVISKAMDYYLERLFEDDFPKDQVGRLYPINIHTLAEVILVYCELPSHRQQMESKLERVVAFLHDTMQYRPGRFAYKYYPWHKVKMPYFRWNQAWTYNALTALERVVS